MPIRHDIDAAKRIVTTWFEGVVDFPQYLAHIEALRGDAEFDARLAKLVFLDPVCEFRLSCDDVEQMAKISLLEPAVRRAIVAPTPAEYGLARMFQTFRELDGQNNFRVFRTEAEAREWLAGGALTCGEISRGG